MIITKSEREAYQLCLRAGLLPNSTDQDGVRCAAEYILVLATKIRDERVCALLETPEGGK